jgi:MFS family permease
MRAGPSDPGDAAPAAAAPDDGEAAYERFIRANLRRNYAGHFVHGMLGMTGFRLVNAPTFLPAYLHTLSGSDLIVGLALGLQQLGAAVSPIAGAARLEHRKRLMPAAVLLGLGMRVPILAMALAGWFLPAQWQLWIIVLMLFAFGLFNGMQRVVFQTLMGKAIPIGLRGRLQAWRNAVGGLVAAALAYAAGRWFIETNALGNGYATTFLLAFVLTSLGLSVLAILMREPEPPTVRARSSIRERFADIPAMLKADRGFFWFNVVTVLAQGARMAAPFTVLYAGQIVPVSGVTLGLFTLMFLGADTVSNLVWGYAGDRWGFRTVTLGSLVVWIAAILALFVARDLTLLLVAFALLGASQAGSFMAQTQVLEFGRRDDVTMRLAVTATSEGAMATVGPLIGGAIATVFGYPALFAVALTFLLAALVVTARYVPETRGRVM